MPEPPGRFKRARIGATRLREGVRPPPTDQRATRGGARSLRARSHRRRHPSVPPPARRPAGVRERSSRRRPGTPAVSRRRSGDLHPWLHPWRHGWHAASRPRQDVGGWERLLLLRRRARNAPDQVDKPRARYGRELAGQLEAAPGIVVGAESPLWTEGRVTTKLGLHAKGGTGNFDVAGCRWLNAGLGKVLGRPPTSESQRSPGTPITLDDNNKLRYYS